MTPDEFVETVGSDNETALSRLGSSKSLYAATAGEMDPDAVFAAAFDAADAAAETFAAWADEASGDAADAFAAAADAEADRADEIGDRLDDHESATTPAMVAALRGLDDTAARAGGYVGWALVTTKATEQYTGFFVGQADPQTASLFRGFGDDLDAHLERGRELLAAICDDDADWAAAREAAGDVVQAAYDEYTETLEGLGVNPKPVC